MLDIGRKRIVLIYLSLILQKFNLADNMVSFHLAHVQRAIIHTT